MGFSGAGMAGAGLSSAGYGLSGTGAANIVVPLPDPLTGKSLTGRLINFQNGGSDYVFTADGRVSGMPTVQQLVLLALMDPNVLQGIQDQGPNFQRQVAGRVQRALSPFIRKGWVALVGLQIVQPQNSPNAAAIFVQWKDLTLAAPGRNATTTSNTFTTAIPTT
jgi:hypothetical protein